MKKIIFQEIIPGSGYNFKTGNGSILKSEDIAGPLISRIRKMWKLRRKKRLGYRIDLSIEEFQIRQLIEDCSKEGSIKIKITRKKNQIFEKLFSIYEYTIQKWL